LFLKLIIEQSIDDERFRMRRLEMLLSAADPEESVSLQKVRDEIRRWIETTQGDGFLDLVSPQA